MKFKRILEFMLIFLIAFTSSFSVVEATINWGTAVYISRAGQVVDSITVNGKTVSALYAPRNSVAGYDSSTTYSCAAFVKRFYSEIYGIGLNNLYPGNTPNISSGSGQFYKTSSPKVGDIAASSEHWAIVKAVNGNSVTLIEQNAWNTAYTAAMVGRTLTSENSYWFWRWSGNDMPVSHNPEGYVDIAEGISGGIQLAGWALDKDNAAANLDIHVYIGGEAGSATAVGYPIKANKYRPDVGYHAFEDTILTNKYGQQSVYVYAINIGGGNNVCLGSYTVNIKKPDSEAPVLVGCNITDLNEKGYTVTCTWSDNIGVTKVEFPTWNAETQTGDDATLWYQGSSAEAGKTTSTWKFTFSKAETGKKYFTHIYAWDAAGNHTGFPLTLTTPIEAKNDTTAPVFENVMLKQQEEGTVTLSVELSDDAGLGKLSRPGNRMLWFSADENSSCILADYSTCITRNINCWNNLGGSVPIVEKKYTVEETTSVQCDSIVGYGIMAQDLSGNYAAGNQLLNNEYIRYLIKSGNIKGQKNKSIEIVLNQGEEITLSAIREKLSQYNNLNGSDANLDAKNERILKKSNCPDNNMISNREEEKNVVLTANEPGTEYVYFVNLLSGELSSCKITVMSASYMLGDVYQDEKIDGKDVNLLLQYRLKKRELAEEQITAGDVYADGKIDGKDVSKLLQYRLGKIGSLK